MYVLLFRTIIQLINYTIALQVSTQQPCPQYVLAMDHITQQVP